MLLKTCPGNNGFGSLKQLVNSCLVLKRKRKKKDIILELQKQEVVIGRNERSRFGNT